VGIRRHPDSRLSAPPDAGPHPPHRDLRGRSSREQVGLNDDFRDLLAALDQAGARYLVVGAHALAVHGVPRSTGDIDIWVQPETVNAERTIQALARFGAPLAAMGVTVEDLARPGIVYQIGLPPRRIDILTEISGVQFDDAWSSRVVQPIAGLSVPFLGRDQLLRNKRAAGRPKDLLDVAQLERR
jgi:hypothetical protein